MSTVAQDQMVAALHRWNAVKAEHVGDAAAVMHTRVSEDPLLAEREVDTVTATLGVVGVDGGEALKLGKAMASQVQERFMRALRPGQERTVDLRIVFATAWVDGVGLGAVYRAMRTEQQLDQARDRAVQAERLVETQGDRLELANIALQEVRTQLEQARAELARTQLAARPWHRRIVDAVDRKRTATEAHDA